MQEEYRQLDDKYARLNKEHKEQQVVKIQFKKKEKKKKELMVLSVGST